MIYFSLSRHALILMGGIKVSNFCTFIEMCRHAKRILNDDYLWSCFANSTYVCIFKITTVLRSSAIYELFKNELLTNYWRYIVGLS